MARGWAGGAPNEVPHVPEVVLGGKGADLGGKRHWKLGKEGSGLAQEPS